MKAKMDLVRLEAELVRAKEELSKIRSTRFRDAGEYWRARREAESRISKIKLSMASARKTLIKEKEQRSEFPEAWRLACWAAKLVPLDGPGAEWHQHFQKLREGS